VLLLLLHEQNQSLPLANYSIFICLAGCSIISIF
jgi:hypothetical protein